MKSVERTSIANLAFVLLLAAFLLRFFCLRGDLWLDEILSLNAVRTAAGLPEVLWRSHDNNHPLNSLWLFLWRDIDVPFILRGLSFLSGIGSLLLVATWPAQDSSEKPPSRGSSRTERLVRLTLFGFSYPLVLYDSEARGYASMVFGGLLAWRALWNSSVSAERLRWWNIIQFWIGCVLCGLSHASGLQIYAALFVWSAVEVISGAPRATLFKKALYFHGPVVLAAVWLWLEFIQKLPPGSGALRPGYEVLVSALSIGFGGPLVSASSPEWSMCALSWALCVLVLFVRGSLVLYRQNRQFVLTCIAGIAVAPLGAMIFFEPRVIYERYFLSSLVFGYFLVAKFLAFQWGSGAQARSVVVGILVALLIGNGVHFKALLTVHRGSYRALLETILNHDPNHDPSNPVIVARDHPFRIDTVSNYYVPKIDGGERKGRSRLLMDSGPGATWQILHSQDPYWQPPESVARSGNLSPDVEGGLPTGAALQRVRCEFSAPLSGWSWCAYRFAPSR